MIHGKNCEIVEENDINFLRMLDDELSFKIMGAQYSRAYIAGRWDGIYRVLERDLTFSYGLLSRVIDLYKKNNKSVRIIDQRPEKSKVSSIDIITPLTQMGKPPYQHQLEALEAAKNNDCGIIRSATGSGKSLISALVTAHFGKKTIIYVIGTDLLYQFYKFYQSIFGKDVVGIVGDGLCEIKDINIVSIWTAGQALGLKKSKIVLDSSDEEKTDPSKYDQIRELLRTAKVHQLDECHLASCDTIQEINKAINPEYIYGMSASPWRDDGSDLLIESILGKNIIDISASLLIDRGILVKPTILFKKVPSMRIKKQYQTVYKNYVINNDVRNNIIVDSTIQLIEQGYKPLILYNNINHGKNIFDKIKNKIPCVLLSGADDLLIRQQAKEDIESGKIKAILASKIYDIGVDIPCLSGLVLAGSGKSSVRALQRIGRVIRKYETSSYKKKRAAIVDFNDDVHYLREHSKERYKIYLSENGFEVFWSK